MAALFDDVAVRHEQYDACVAYSRQTVRDHEARSAAHERVHRLAYLRLRPRIHAARGLVEDEHGRVAKKHACDRQQLSLSDGESGSVARKHRVVALRHRTDEVVHLRHLRRAYDVVPRSVRFAVSYVFRDRSSEQPCVLEHHAELRAQSAARQFRSGHSVEKYLSAVYFVKPHEQIDERGLARAGGAYYGYLLSGSRVETYIVHEDVIGRIAEADVPE